jgi:hypothetical protein
MGRAMPRFSKYFKLGLSQQALDFVDVSTDYDTPVYVDPYAIEIRDDIWAAEASEHIRTLFSQVLVALRGSDDIRAENLMSHFREPSETFLGVSRGKPCGRGVGQKQSTQLIHAIKKSDAFITGLLSDLSEMSLYVEGMDRDKISDLTTNIIRHLLVDYTQQQCDLYGIKTKRYNGPAGWNRERNNWEAKHVQLPFIGDKAVLLVPKYIVRRRLSLDSQEFYNKQITDILITENLRANSSLVQTIKGGKERKVYKKDVREKNPKSKSLIVEMIKKYPHILTTFKEIAKKHSSMRVFSEDDLSIQDVCAGIIDTLPQIPPGAAHASDYHSIMLSAFTVLFYPDLILPRKEWEIHDGRKRIDFIYTNAADNGFFAHRRDGKNTQANIVIVECKNYTDDIGNPELDQLCGRFDDNRGQFGILACRQVDDPQTLAKRCRDMSSRSQGFVIVLTDDDILAMLKAKAALEDGEVEEILHNKFAALLQ